MSSMEGNKNSQAQSVPKRAVSSAMLVVAASRIVAMSSPSQLTQIEDSLSVKKSFPNCLASWGVCSIMANRILHFPSCAKSTIAGKSDCDNKSTPMTLFKLSNDDIRLRRTSDAASRNKSRMGGTKCVMVASFPKMGASSVATMARAARTCSLSSSVKEVTRLTRRSAAVTLVGDGSSRPPSAPSGKMVASHPLATTARLKVAAVRTSASGSWRSFS
mmetsp:Transcript_7929/g.19495  ORF Transcript_7929/g.19495 Transcript_7929/m.19495 type:complete len:217 (+) Transcript_7929:570-1220(+)